MRVVENGLWGESKSGVKINPGVMINDGTITLTVDESWYRTENLFVDNIDNSIEFVNSEDANIMEGDIWVDRSTNHIGYHQVVEETPIEAQEVIMTNTEMTPEQLREYTPYMTEEQLIEYLDSLDNEDI